MKKEKIQTGPLSGFMELLPAQQMMFNKMLDTIRRTYEAFGFIPIETPILERAEVLLAKAGGETEKQIYQFKKGDTNLAMRFDHTVPLARYVAEYYNELTFPFRRYAIGKVYRGERPQAGRFREFYQCDIDIIGDNNLDLRFDAEIPSIIYMIMRELGFDKFTIRVNNRKIFNGLFSGLGIADKSTGIMQSVDKLEKIGTAAVRLELQELGLQSEAVQNIFDFIGLKGSCDEVLDGLRKLTIDDSQFNEGVKELSEVVTMIKQLGVPESNFTIDLAIARGLDYYTGTVYETRLDEYPEIGSICSGGRYDDLASYYTNRLLPGVGISIGLTRLFDQLYKKGVLKTGPSTPTKLLVLPMMDDLGPSLSLATTLRNKGIPTEISLVQGKTKKRLGYADKLHIPYVVFIGESEIQENRYTLKNLDTGEQESITLEELVNKIK